MDEIYKLQLHEKTQLKTPGPADVFVTRVPGGWLYEYQISTASILEVVFVPFNNEYQKTPSNGK